MGIAGEMAALRQMDGDAEKRRSLSGVDRIDE
jgi:hypothetical protein